MVWVLIDALINHTAPRGWASVLGPSCSWARSSSSAWASSGNTSGSSSSSRSDVRPTSSTSTGSGRSRSRITWRPRREARRWTKRRSCRDHDWSEGIADENMAEDDPGRPRRLDSSPSLVEGPHRADAGHARRLGVRAPRGCSTPAVAGGPRSRPSSDTGIRRPVWISRDGCSSSSTGLTACSMSPTCRATSARCRRLRRRAGAGRHRAHRRRP